MATASRKRPQRQTVDPLSILREVDPVAAPADKPPAIANYRKADMHGIACAFCQKFAFTGVSAGGPDPADNENELPGLPVGVCDQWEANVDGWFVCDRFASGLPAFDHNGEEVWDVAMSAGLSDPVAFKEIYFAGTSPATERDGRIVKGILRTGEWDETPTPIGKLKKKLKIIKDGQSDYANGVISLAEILENFKRRAPIKRVQMPLALKKNDDHIADGNLARVNTGFVEDLWLEERDGYSELMAACDIRDDETLEAVRKRTLEDVSSGVPFHPQYGAFLEHVCHTNTPFIDGLTGWLAASDETTPDGVREAEIVHHVLPKDEEETEPVKEVVEDGEGGGDNPPKSGEIEEEETGDGDPPRPKLSFLQVIAAARAALADQFNLSLSSYTVLDASDERVTIEHALSETTWTVPYEVTDSGVKLVPYAEWETVEKEEIVPPANAAPSATDPDLDPELAAARALREMRLAASGQPTTIHNGGADMTVISREELDRLELSDAQRAVFTRILDENSSLSATSREKDADSRIEELKGWGFSDRPGALKLYRRVFLSDDGGPAVVLFSDDGKAKEPVSALKLLDDFIDALKGTEGVVNFSDQASESGNDIKPPNEGGKDRPAGERAKEMRDFLYPNGR